jgi:hypothetical protein
MCPCAWTSFEEPWLEVPPLNAFMGLHTTTLRFKCQRPFAANVTPLSSRWASRIVFRFLSAAIQFEFKLLIV